MDNDFKVPTIPKIRRKPKDGDSKPVEKELTKLDLILKLSFFFGLASANEPRYKGYFSKIKWGDLYKLKRDSILSFYDNEISKIPIKYLRTN